jgi:hypothetical protein
MVKITANHNRLYTPNFNDIGNDKGSGMIRKPIVKCIWIGKQIYIYIYIYIYFLNLWKIERKLMLVLLLLIMLFDFMYI